MNWHLLFCSSFVVIIYNMQDTAIQSVIDKPLFTPNYLNIEYVFSKIVEYARPVYDFFASSETWTNIGITSALLTIIFIGIIVFSLVRAIEIQNFYKEKIDHEIAKALKRQKEMDRNTNPRWHYIQTLIESPNSSDWRVAIIEADSLMEEILKERGIAGNTVSELLEGAKSNGYQSIQDAWEAHLVRNQIAHQGSEFILSQIEGRRVIKMFQNFFEELRVI